MKREINIGLKMNYLLEDTRKKKPMGNNWF